MDDGTGRRSRIAVAGFGNVLLGDDGFGVEVIKRLQTVPLPVNVELFEVGIGGMELVLKLMDRFDEMIVVDAVRRGEAPGTLYLFPPSNVDLRLRPEERIDPHLTEPTGSMKMAMQLGILPKKTLVVGCEPDSCALGLGLSRPVSASVNGAVEKIREIIGNALNAGSTNA